MRRQIPQNINVVLEEAKVDPDRVEVVQIAQLADVDDLLHPTHRSSVNERVIDHQHEAALLSEPDQLLALSHGSGHRLFDEHVLALLEGPPAEFVVCPNRCGDDYGIN